MAIKDKTHETRIQKLECVVANLLQQNEVAHAAYNRELRRVHNLDEDWNPRPWYRRFFP